MILSISKIVNGEETSSKDFPLELSTENFKVT